MGARRADTLDAPVEADAKCWAKSVLVITWNFGGAILDAKKNSSLSGCFRFFIDWMW